MTTNVFEKSQGGLVPNPNILINSCLTVDQRAGVPYSANGFGFDRLYLSLSGATGTLNRVENNYTTDSFSAPYYAELDVTVGNDNAGLVFSSEDSRRFRGGKTMTVSFWYRLTGKDLVVFEAANSGSGGATVSKNLATLTQAAGWTYFSFTFEASKWSQSYDANDYHQIAVKQNSSDATTTPFKLDIADVKLEFGVVATPWIMEDPQINMARCQRFYQHYESFYLWSVATSNTGRKSYTPLPAVPRISGNIVTVGNWDSGSGTAKITDYGMLTIDGNAANSGNGQAVYPVIINAELI